MKKFLLFFIVLISIIIYFATAQSRENARLVKELACPNGDYEIEIIDDNYTVEDIPHFYISTNREIDTTKFKRPIKIHAVNFYAATFYPDFNMYGRVIAKGYDYFIPYDSITKALQEAMVDGSDGYFCNLQRGYVVNRVDSEKLFEIFENNLKNKKDKK